eukprot:5706241-Prymnesium_polylepis.1
MLALLEKTMGFLVGWGWYDVLQALFNKDRAGAGKAGPGTNFSLAVTATIVSFLWITSFGKPSPPSVSVKDRDRSANEQLFLANALGLMQGWAWADFVASVFKLISTHAPSVVAVRATLSFVTTVLLTVVIISFRILMIRVEERYQKALMEKYMH